MGFIAALRTALRQQRQRQDERRERARRFLAQGARPATDEVRRESVSLMDLRTGAAHRR